MVAISIKPSQKSLDNVKSKLKSIFLRHNGKSVDSLINEANEIIRGYGRSKNAWQTWVDFKKLDNYLYLLQRRWMTRAHPSKGTDWCIKKYYSLSRKPEKGIFDKWTFTSPTGRPMLKFRLFHRSKTMSSKVIEYVPVSGLMCIDDKEARQYFMERKALLFERNFLPVLNKRHFSLYKQQSGNCLVCGEEIFNGEPLNIYHILEKFKGGDDVLNNMVLLHRECHYKVHHCDKLKEWKMFFTVFKTNMKNTSQRRKADKTNND